MRKNIFLLGGSADDNCGLASGGRDNLSMDVSVIFATHNRADILNDVFNAWRAVDRATVYSYEIICSDDESTDETVDIIKSIQDLPVRLIENKKGGAARARNAALRIALGKLVIFTGDDIFPCEDFINRHYENYLKYGDQVATLGRLDWHKDIPLNHLMKHITEIGCEQFGFIALPAYQLIDFRHFYTSNISVSSAMLSSLDSYFNTDFDKYGFEDIEFGYRLQKNGMKIYYDPDILASHHHVYDSVEKFCRRQISAGEELVVFSHMHDDLEDKCICDIKNCTDAFKKYAKLTTKSSDRKGRYILTVVKLAKKYCKLLEKRIKKNSGQLSETICSTLYAGIFKFSFYYGIALRISMENRLPLDNGSLALFAVYYMKKPVYEIYWNTGFGFNENESRKWICWDDSETVIEKALPPGVHEVWIAPLKDYCIAEIYSIEFILENGSCQSADISWHNACNVNGQIYDFTHTNDPMILVNHLPEHYRTIRVKMKVNYMHHSESIYKSIRHAAGKMLRRNQRQHPEYSKLDIKYAFGQRRRIQIGIAGALDPAQKKDLILAYSQQTEIFGTDVNISEMENMRSGYIDYIYHPEKEPLDITQFLQVVYLLLNNVTDYVLVSKSYIDFPQIACKNIFDVLIYSPLINLKECLSSITYAKGRYMRLPGFLREDNFIDIHDYCPTLILEKEYYLHAFSESFRISERNYGALECKKPVIFVIPVFLAVGGVERNTIEVMKCIREHYDFCLLTLERHTKQQGSLHYQLKGICRYIFDLREITEHDHFLECLFELNKIFHPQLLWFCNNSPWLEKNLGKIQTVFKDSAIVMQDAYDTKIGWIEYYNSPDIQNADRYIAVTELIKNTFIKKYKLPESKIDVIYSVIDDCRIKEVKNNSVSYEKLCQKYSLDPSKEHYAYVARLTEQKDPLRFLQLAYDISKKWSDEIQFVMVGDGIFREEVDSFIQKKHITNLIQIPYVANTPELIGIIDGLIITSRYEGLPIVSIEAMGMGTPILSTDSGDTKRFVETNHCGLIIDDAMSDKENFIRFRRELTTYRENAFQHSEKMLEYFSAGNIAKQYLQTFQKAVNKA